MALPCWRPSPPGGPGDQRPPRNYPLTPAQLGPVDAVAMQSSQAPSADCPPSVMEDRLCTAANDLILQTAHAGRRGAAERVSRSFETALLAAPGAKSCSQLLQPAEVAVLLGPSQNAPGPLRPNPSCYRPIQISPLPAVAIPVYCT